MVLNVCSLHLFNFVPHGAKVFVEFGIYAIRITATCFRCYVGVYLYWTKFVKGQ